MSGVWVHTGKLGSGKTLTAVEIVGNAIRLGLPVASNVDLHMANICSRNSMKSYVRLPDKPKKIDLEAIGSTKAAITKDDNDFGYILLDECAHWLNARNWQDKSNQEMINFLIYIRKLGWKVLFIVQDISALDKQARKLFAEHVVYCRRTDRINTFFMKILTFVLFFGQKPKFFVRTIRYGDLPTAPIAEVKWTFVAGEVYTWYDTNQIFTDSYEHGAYSVLPNKYKRRPPKTSPGKLVMGLTKIYMRKHIATSFLLFFTAMIFMLSYVYLVMPTKSAHRKQLEFLQLQYEEVVARLNEVTNNVESVSTRPGLNSPISDSTTDKKLDEPKQPIVAFESRIALGGYDRVYFNFDDQRISSDQLRSMGYQVKDRGCSYLLVNNITQDVYSVPSPC